MALTPQEIDVYNQVRKQKGSHEQAIKVVKEFRDYQGKQERKTQAVAEEQRVEGVKTGEIAPESFEDVLAGPKKDFVGGLGTIAKKQGQEKITPATGKLFSKDSTFLKNLGPSLLKEGGNFLEMIGNPIESGKNLFNFIKTVTKEGAKTTPILGKFIKQGTKEKEDIKAMQDKAQEFKAKVKEEGLSTVLSKSVQENPAVALSLIGSPLKKIEKTLGVESKIAKLDTKAEKAIGEYINPTKKATKLQAKELTPEFINKLKTGEIKAADREIVKQFAESQVDNYGKQIGDYIEAGKVKGEVDFGGMIDVLAKEDAKLRVDGAIMPGSEAQVRFIDSQLNFLQQLEKNYGKNLPAEKQLELRQKYDVVFDKAVTRDNITKFQDDLQVKLADNLRAELAKNNPDLANLNKEFHFYKGLENVLEETIQRKTGQADPGLIQTIQQNAQGGLGAAIGGTAGNAVFGPGGAVAGALIGGNIGAKLTKVFSNPKYKLVTAAKKSELADAIARGDRTKVENILDSIIIAHGMGEISPENNN